MAGTKNTTKRRYLYKNGGTNAKDPVYGCKLCDNFSHSRFASKIQKGKRTPAMSLERHVREKHPEMKDRWKELCVRKEPKERKNEKTAVKKEEAEEEKKRKKMAGGGVVGEDGKEREGDVTSVTEPPNDTPLPVILPRVYTCFGSVDPTGVYQSVLHNECWRTIPLD